MKKLELLTSKLGAKVLKVTAEEKSSTKGIAMMSVTKEEVANVMTDYLAMQKALKKAGVTIIQPKHYTEEPGFKRPLKESDVPAFLRKGKPSPSKPKRKRVKL